MKTILYTIKKKKQPDEINGRLKYTMTHYNQTFPDLISYIAYDEEAGLGYV